MSLESKRRLVRSLLLERNVADASAAYYALYHPDDKTELHTLVDLDGISQGYVCLSRTGMDLFRPLLTLRLPTSTDGTVDPDQSATLLYSAIPAGMQLILNGPSQYGPVISALFEIQSELPMNLLMLDRTRYEPVINVLVTESESYNGLPRFVIRSKTESGTDDVAASAGLNWLSPSFAEIYVHTKPAYRRRGFGRSVVAAVVKATLDGGRMPLYNVGIDNEASIQLAESVGFVDTGLVNVLYEATLKPRLDG